MIKIQAVIFDIGGVLVRTEDPQPREQLAQRFGLDRAGLDTLVFGSPAAQAVERGEQEEPAVWQAVQAQLGLSPAALQDFQDQFWAGDRLDEHLFAWLAGLRPRYKTGLLTNSWLCDPLTLFVTRFHQPETMVRAAFDAVISSAAVGVQKPAAQIYQAALDALAVRPEEALFVDDFERNTLAAGRLGLHTVLFRGPQQAAAEIQALLGD